LPKALHHVSSVRLVVMFKDERGSAAGTTPPRLCEIPLLLFGSHGDHGGKEPGKKVTQLCCGCFARRRGGAEVSRLPEASNNSHRFGWSPCSSKSAASPRAQHLRASAPLRENPFSFLVHAETAEEQRQQRRLRSCAAGVSRRDAEKKGEAQRCCPVPKALSSPSTLLLGETFEFECGFAAGAASLRLCFLCVSA
jgi:hypothetical protein